MLKEFEHVMQVPDEPVRRWFDDDYFDLIVWYEPADEIWGFQLCYDREWKARALTWSKKYGYKHTGIDDGDQGQGGAKTSPVLIEDGLLDTRAVAARFEKAAAEIPAEIRLFVLSKLVAYRGGTGEK